MARHVQSDISSPSRESKLKQDGHVLKTASMGNCNLKGFSLDSPMNPMRDLSKKKEKVYDEVHLLLSILSLFPAGEYCHDLSVNFSFDSYFKIYHFAF